MILERVDSYGVLGVEINRNMEITSIIAATNLGLGNKPDLAGQFSAIMSALDGVAVLKSTIATNLATIITQKQNLKTAKRTLEIAVKAYNVGATASMVLIDVKPAVNGSPPATGTSAALTPLKVAVEKATKALQDLEDLIQVGFDELQNLTAQYKEDLDEAVDNLIKKIADLGNKNIEI